MKRYAIIVAGGSGSRTGAAVPKQFILLGGKPLLMHTIERFYDWDNTIQLIIVLPKMYREYWVGLCKEHGFKVEHTATDGGETRFDSVKCGLKLIDGQGVIAVHDGARPFVTPSLLNEAFDCAEKHGTAVPVVGIKDSMRIVRGSKNLSSTVDREDFMAVQTPQVFWSEILLKAYERPYTPLFTDDASVVEDFCKEIHLVRGEDVNIKITTPLDLKFAEFLIHEQGWDGTPQA
jgi:2-C-methyl-D-erythritol 4-phosphate cytidylyltransferase